MIEPVDEDERAVLLAELLIERFGRPPYRKETAKRIIAQRRRVLCGTEKNTKSASKRGEVA